MGAPQKSALERAHELQPLTQEQFDATPKDTIRDNLNLMVRTMDEYMLRRAAALQATGALTTEEESEIFSYIQSGNANALPDRYWNLLFPSGDGKIG